MEALQAGQQWQRALELFTQLPSRSLRPDTFSFGAAIRATAAADNWRLAFFLLAEMPEAGVAMDGFALSSAIQACEQGSQWQVALDMLVCATSLRVEVDAVIGTAAIAATGKAGHWQHALSVLQLMSMQVVRRNAVSYSAAITACAKKGQWNSVLGLVQEMVEKDCRIFTSKYDHTVQAGSSLDCFKHTVLVSLLQTSTSTADPVLFVDAHAGRGIYNIDSRSAGHLNFQSGIAQLIHRFGDTLPAHPAVREYLAAVRRHNSDGVLSFYPGSAALALSWLRPQDTAMFFELSEDMFVDLTSNLRGLNRGCRQEVICADSYWWMLHKAIPDGKGIVFLDPPCDPYELHIAWSLFMVRHLRQERPRLCLAMWYPCLDALQISNLHGQAASLGVGEIVVAEFAVTDPTRSSLQSSGVLVFNPPPEAAAMLEDLLHFLARSLESGTAEVHTKVFQLCAETNQRVLCCVALIRFLAPTKSPQKKSLQHTVQSLGLEAPVLGPMYPESLVTDSHFWDSCGIIGGGRSRNSRGHTG